MIMIAKLCLYSAILMYSQNNILKNANYLEALYRVESSAKAVNQTPKYV